MKITCEINGKVREIEVEAEEILLDVLRREGYLGVKRGCNSGDCGSCTIIIDGEIYNSCQMFAVKAHGRKIMTVEGLGTIEEPHVLQTVFAETGAVQCGYCIPGMLMSAKSLLDKTKNNPTTDEIKKGIAGNLCRCTGYVKQIEAIEKAAKILKKGRGK